MYDLKSYADKKAKGLINKVQKTNTETPEALTYAVYEKKYEVDETTVPPTVNQVSDEVTAVTKKELDDRKAELEAEIASIEAFENDAQNGD